MPEGLTGFALVAGFLLMLVLEQVQHASGGGHAHHHHHFGHNHGGSTGNTTNSGSGNDEDKRGEQAALHSHSPGQTGPDGRSSANALVDLEAPGNVPSTPSHKAKGAFFWC